MLSASCSESFIRQCCLFSKTEVAVGKLLDIGLFRVGLVISPPVSWRDCCCGGMLRAQLGVNDNCLSRWAGVLLSALLQAPQMKGVGDWRWRWWGADIAYQVLWGAAMTHVRSAPYLMMYAGRQYNIRQLHGCIHAVSNVKVWNITRGFIYIPEQPAHPLKSVLDPWLC